MSEYLRRQVIDTALEMNRCGINQGTSGNLSVRLDQGMLITPSRMTYSRLNTDDIVHVDPDTTCKGKRNPSSEWRIHHDIYRARTDAGAVLHAHPVHCTALASLHRPIPAFHYMVAVAGGRDIRCAPYATFGTEELSKHVLTALDGRKACLMANHGLLCLASDLESALALAIEVEHLAQTYLQCLTAGEPQILDDAEMESILEKFQTYGQR
jgi:L-fuculose-phosphate aldolase